MGDLISRSALIEEINKQVKGWAKNGIMPSLFSAIAIVQNQPTAYDVGKVVAELQKQVEMYGEQADKYKQEGFKEFADKLFGKRNCYMNAIDIVKRGGRDE